MGEAIGLRIVARRCSAADHQPELGDRIVVRISDGREWIGPLAAIDDDHWFLRGVNAHGLRDVPLGIERHRIVHWRRPPSRGMARSCYVETDRAELSTGRRINRSLAKDSSINASNALRPR